MASPKYSDLRQAIYDRLDAQLTASIWSPNAPRSDEGEALTPFPYVAIVQATETTFNTDGDRGAQFVVQIDGYARATASISVENAISDLHSEVRDALEYYGLTVANAAWVDTQFETMSLGWSEDGHTRRFVSLYRITLDET